MKKIYLILLMVIGQCTWLHADQVIVSMKQETKDKVATMDIEYNDAGLIAKTVYQDNRSNSIISECTYDSGSFLVKETMSDLGQTYQWLYEGTLSDGRLEKIGIDYDDYVDYEASVLTYSQDGHLVRIVDNTEEVQSTIEMTWTDGNITASKETYSDDNYVYQTNLTYGEACSDLIVKWMMFFNYELGDAGVWMFPFLGTPSRMLPIQREEEYRGRTSKISYQYDKDSNGHVTAIKKYKEGELHSTITLTWGERQSAGVDGVIAEKKVPAATYTLEGRKARPGQKGIVISNGRKIVR